MKNAINEANAIKLLKLFLAGLFFLFTVLQTLSFPGQFRYMAQTSPNDAAFRWPATFIVGFIFLCAQIVLISIWKLLKLIQCEEIFTAKSLPWFNRIMSAIFAAAIAPFGILVFLLFYGDDPGLPIVIFTFLGILSVLFLVTYLLKSRTEKVIELIRN